MANKANQIIRITRLHPGVLSGIVLFFQAAITAVLALGAIAGLTVLASQFYSPMIGMIRFLAVLVLFLALYLAILGLMRAIPRINALELDQTGFSYRATLFRTRHAWADCHDFSVFEIKFLGLTLKRFVVFNSSGKKSLLSPLVRLRCGHDFALPFTYKMKAGELAALLVKQKSSSVLKVWQPAAPQSIPGQSIIAQLSDAPPPAPQPAARQPASAQPARANGILDMQIPAPATSSSGMLNQL